MTNKTILTRISFNLYKLIIKEKEKLRNKELKKVRSRRKKINFYHASENIVKKLKR